MKTDQVCIETQPGLNRDSTDPQPPPPDAARFDKTLDAWVLSRYADVLRALREPGLCQVGPRSRYRSGTCDKNAQSRRRAKVRAALPYWRLAEWQPQMQLLAHNMMDELPRGRSIDLLSEFLWPWSLAVTLAIIDSDPAHSRHLADLAHYLPGGEIDCKNAVVRSHAARTVAELKSSFRMGLGIKPVCESAFRVLSQFLLSSIVTASFAFPKWVANTKFKKLDRRGALGLGKSVFLGTSQTIPLFLANAWRALFRHPAEVARLWAEPALMPRAIEELLRYAGVVHTLFRQATVKVDIGGVKISENQRVILKLRSANWDPAQFPEPDRLDITRSAPGQVALGAGPNSCVGAALVRIAAAVATKALIDKFVVEETDDTVEWYLNSTVCSPASLRVLLQSRLTAHES
jgi:cytochrome P450